MGAETMTLCVDCKHWDKGDSTAPCADCSRGPESEQAIRLNLPLNWEAQESTVSLPQGRECRDCAHEDCPTCQAPCEPCLADGSKPHWELSKADAFTDARGEPHVLDYTQGGEAIEADPHGTSAHTPGAKLDAGKIMGGVLGDFGLALLAVAEVGTFGANKYSRGGWQQVPNGIVRYTDACWRHLLKERYDALDDDSKMLHAAHFAWNALARLELMLRVEKGEA